MIRLFTALILGLLLLTSCDKSHESDLYGKDKPLKVMDKDGNVVNQVYTSSWVGMLDCYVVGGMGENYSIEVADTSVLSIIFNKNTPSALGFIKHKPHELLISAKKIGTTDISITDTDINQTIHLQVDVIDAYSPVQIKESTVEGYDENMLLAFRISESNEYRVLTKNGKEYITSEVGTYKFGNWNDGSPSDWEVTLTCGDKHTVWSITDADNNKDGHKHYLSDVMRGLDLQYKVFTKFQPLYYYPVLFRFTDTSNPDRTFITGPAGDNFAYPFE